MSPTPTDHKERIALKRQRNLIAKALRDDSRYHKKVQRSKVEKKRDHRLSPVEIMNMDPEELDELE